MRRGTVGGRYTQATVRPGGDQQGAAGRGQSHTGNRWARQLEVGEAKEAGGGRATISGRGGGWGGKGAGRGGAGREGGKAGGGARGGQEGGAGGRGKRGWEEEVPAGRGERARHRVGPRTEKAPAAGDRARGARAGAGDGGRGRRGEGN